MRICKEDIQVIEIMLMDQHKRMDQVAAKFNVTRQRIWQLCKKHNINPYRPIDRECYYCNKAFTTTRALVRKNKGLYCSEKCYFTHRKEIGDYHPWRHGLRIARVKIKKWLGHSLPIGCVVHHEDGDCRNNEFSNIYVFPSHSEHLKYHHAKRHNKAVLPYKELWELPGMIDQWIKS